VAATDDRTEIDLRDVGPSHPPVLRPTRTQRIAYEWLWRRYARVYDALEGIVGYGEMLDAVVSAAGCVQGLIVVEVGCGTGNLLVRLGRDAPARLIGIDASGAMLTQARTKLGAQLSAGQIDLQESDAIAALATLAPDSVDVLVAANVLYALPDRAAFWRSAARVLRPAGRLVISNPDRHGIGPALRQQWRAQGAAGFTDRRLPGVLGLNLVIELLSVGGRFEFPSWRTLTVEAAEGGLARAELNGRCYGGPADGLNLVGTFRPS
jgi:ubiquinone/menaquinone biosynthesis C-methylase UbiE